MWPLPVCGKTGIVCGLYIRQKIGALGTSNHKLACTPEFVALKQLLYQFCEILGSALKSLPFLIYSSFDHPVGILVAQVRLLVFTVILADIL